MLSSSIEGTKEMISELESKKIEIIQSEQQRGNRLKWGEVPQNRLQKPNQTNRNRALGTDLCDCNKRFNIHIIGIPEERRKRKELKK